MGREWDCSAAMPYPSPSTPANRPHPDPRRVPGRLADARSEIPSARLILFGVLALALALRLPGFTESLWIDELYTSNLFCGPTVVLLKTLFTDIHPPF